MYNRIILVGNLTRDIETRYTPSGTAIANTGIATNRRFKGSDGQPKEEVMCIDLTFFGRTAEIAAQYLHKGSKILVEGRLKLEQWTAQDGTKRSKHVVTVDSMQMLDSRSDGGQAGGQAAQPTPATHQQPTQQAQPPLPEVGIDEDSIPF